MGLVWNPREDTTPAARDVAFMAATLEARVAVQKFLSVRGKAR